MHAFSIILYCACAYAHAASHAIVQKITLQPLKLTLSTKRILKTTIELEQNLIQLYKVHITRVTCNIATSVQ